MSSGNQILSQTKEETGYCVVCGRQSTFSFDSSIITDRLREAWKISDRLATAFNRRESMFCTYCGSSFRIRRLCAGLIETFSQQVKRCYQSLPELLSDQTFRRLRIGEINSCGTLHDYLKEQPNLHYSEYTPKTSPGEVHDGIRCEDLQSLTYPDNYFDIILTSETLEHVPDPDKAWREIHRTLKDNGYHIFTIPLIPSQRQTIRRAQLVGGIREDLLEPAYHGPPQQQDILVYTDFGTDLVEKLNRLGLKTDILYLNPDDELDVAVVLRSRKLKSLLVTSRSGGSGMLEWTGERYVPWMEEASIGYEHLHRYAYATQFTSDKNVLDLACGEGYGSHLLARTANRVTGIDIDVEAIRHASNRYLRSNLEFKAGSITAIPLEGRHLFDVIVCYEAIEHIDDHEKLLAEVKRLLVPDGIFIVSTPNKWAYSDEPQSQNPFHVHELYFQEFKSLLENYFSRVRFFAQRLFCGSNMWPLHLKGNPSLVEYVIERGAKEFLFVENDKKVPMYFIAIASDKEQAIDYKVSLLTDSSNELLNQKDRLQTNTAAERDRLVIGVGELQSERERLAQRVGELQSERERLAQRVGELETARQQAEQLAARQNLLTWEIEDLNNQVRQMSGAREQIFEECTQLRHSVAQQEEYIASIEGSLAWSLVGKYRRVKQQIFPVGTMRRRAYDSVLKSLKKSRPIKNIPVEIGARDAESGVQSFLYTIPEVPNLIPVTRHQANVDIIICVHDALGDTKRCLEAVVCCSTAPYSLVLVNDGSNQETSDYLCDFASSHGANLIKNDVAKGYTFAANQGMQQSKADYVVLLNSDTIVSLDWLDRMVACMESDRRIGVVGPLSNSASWQSVPEIVNLKGDDWAMNHLPPGMDVSEMGLLVAKYSGRLYPRIPFLNGFCLMIRREVIDELGYFDETNFGRGYGEENDYCLRAGEAGWDLAVADDVYIYHAQSRSYTEDRRKQLYNHAAAALALKHDQTVIAAGVAECQFGRVLEGIRARSGVLAKRKQLLEDGRSHWEGRRLLVLLPVSNPGGGANVIIQEAQAMRQMGIQVKILNLSDNRAAFESWYADAQIPFLYAENGHRVSEFFHDFDAVIATFFTSVDWMEGQNSGTVLSIRGYYIQDFEPNFFRSDSVEFRTAWNSYTRYENLVRLTKTSWNRDVLKEKIGVDCSIVGPSVDLDLYRPRRRKTADWPKRPLRVLAMIRPSSHQRNAQLTMEVLRELSRVYEQTTEVILFGCWPDDPGFQALPLDFRFHNAGILNRRQLAFLFNEVDIFVDFSVWQAMGLTAMEAMACGVAVIVPRNGGASSFATNEENSLVVDTASNVECLNALERLVKDHDLRRHIQKKAMFSICEFFPEKAAYNLLEALFNSGPRSLRPGG
jgi:2-polyprenyl-3-methyl-5-hydroxy-6-metoxy-1,4-benzoquinol methylase/GT2 family glycosyltransferase/glycosyltransferase involved in cell wall biosynthesis